MAHTVLTDCKVYAGGYDFSGDTMGIALNYGVDPVEDTAFGDDTHVFLGGLESFDVALEGAVNLGNTSHEGLTFAGLGAAGLPVTIAPGTGAAGETAYILNAMRASYAPGAQIGELKRYSFSAMASGQRNVRGTVIHNATVTTTGTGTGYQVGAVAAGKSLYAVLHVITVSGSSPTLDVVVESDDNGSFTSATTRVTFAQLGVVGSEYATPVAGAITDDYWRVSYTIGGTGTPTFAFIVTIGIR